MSTNEYTRERPKTITDPSEFIEFMRQSKAFATATAPGVNTCPIQDVYLHEMVLCTYCPIGNFHRPLGNKLSMILLFNGEYEWRCWTELESNGITGDSNKLDLAAVCADSETDRDKWIKKKPTENKHSITMLVQYPGSHTSTNRGVYLDGVWMHYIWQDESEYAPITEGRVVAWCDVDTVPDWANDASLPAI